MNFDVSQSSRSGCDGVSPCVPKSLGVRTIACPKCQPQTRLTRTRAVNGFSAAVSQRANVVRRLVGGTAEKSDELPELTNTARNPGSTTSRGLLHSPRCNRLTSNGC